VGIVCGHLKSAAFAEMLAWQTGIAPRELRGIDFRAKLPDRPANRYGIAVSGERAGGRMTASKPMTDLFGGNWGHGFFKYKACDFCDDVVGETADISIGDAWLPEYERDPAGTNVLVVRSPALHLLLQAAAAAGRLHLETVPAEKAVQSQAGGFRHRRDGLAYRLAVEDESGRWRPRKRVAPSMTGLSPRQRQIQDLRQSLRDASHLAFAEAKRQQDFDVFRRALEPLVVRYDRLLRRPWVLRALGKLKRTLLKGVSLALHAPGRSPRSSRA
jgi:coenzyme F420-reducing hydrogenase beta subunit